MKRSAAMSAEEVRKVFEINACGEVVWKIKSHPSTNPGDIAGNVLHYVSYKGVKYKIPDIKLVLKGETEDPHHSFNVKRGRNPKGKKGSLVGKQDNPEAYFQPGTEEYLNLSKIINKLAKHYSGCSPLEYSDLVSEGWIGALESKKRYRIEDKMAKFKTYAYTYIVGYMKNLVEKEFKRPDTISLILDDDQFLQIPDEKAELDIEEIIEGSQLKRIEDLKGDLKVIADMKMDGFTDIAIAKSMGISRFVLRSKFKEIKHQLNP